MSDFTVTDGKVEMWNGEMREERSCDYCGKTESEVGEVSYHSGSKECWPCWNWRKLDGPAASHWAPVFHLFYSNVDFHDLTKFFPQTLGLTQDETATLFDLMRRAEINCDHALALREARFHNAV
jgi:hypothetical protein